MFHTAKITYNIRASPMPRKWSLDATIVIREAAYATARIPGNEQTTGETLVSSWRSSNGEKI